MFNQNKEIKINSNYSGLFIIYLVTVAVAFIVIIKNKDVWYFGIMKATVWSLCALTKIG
jgi:hypothetical protein